MKEPTIKKETLDVVRQMVADGQVSQEVAEKYFPELRESEDEKIRKEIRNFIWGYPNKLIERDKWLAWLEKQGGKSSIRERYDKIKDSEWFKRTHEGMSVSEEPDNSYCREHCKGFQETGKCFADSACSAKIEAESVDKAKPKFKVGDWVVYYRNDSSREVLQVYDIRDGRYYFTDNVHFSWSVKECDEKSHLWTISDAKGGDVLAYKDEIFLFNCVNNNSVLFHCCYDDNELITDNLYAFIDMELSDVHPATKEQCDLLFQKMYEAGYEWDAEKKELKLLITNGDDFFESENCEQKPSWSEEDEKMLADACIMLDWYQGNNWWKAQHIKNWIKALKQRIGG